MKRKYPIDYKPDVYIGDNKLRFALGNSGKSVLFCISINPSDASNQCSDPTMNSLINVSRKLGYDGCIMVNPAPYRSSNPKDLPMETDENVENNLRIIENLFSDYSGSTILCGWGNYLNDGVKWFADSLYRIIEMAREKDMKLVYIRKTSIGNPSHLSYLNRDHINFDYGNGTYELLSYSYEDVFKQLKNRLG